MSEASISNISVRDSANKSPRSFLKDVAELRASARRGVEDGAVTESYGADREAVIEMLQSAMATEWICVLRYTQHQLSAEGIQAAPIAAHFAEHAAEEQGHAMELGKRIRELGGHPSLDPTKMVDASASEYKECDSLFAMIRENLIAERVAIESYSQMIRFVGEGDPTTRRVLEKILAVEEEHADELADLLAAIDPREVIN